VNSALGLERRHHDDLAAGVKRRQADDAHPEDVEHGQDAHRRRLKRRWSKNNRFND
jgi:hypothetical protein